MWNLREFQSKSNKLCDWLCWGLLVAPGVILNKDGSLQKTFRFRGKDAFSATQEELLITASQLNNVLKRLSGDWAVFVESRRIKSTDYPSKTFPDTITKMMELERKTYFGQGDHYISEYYFTLLYLPPEDKYDRMANAFLEKESRAAEREHDRVQEHLKTFSTEVNRIFSLYREVMSECEELSDDETLTYLHNCISTKRTIIKTPEVPMFLDCILYDSPLTGGLKPALGAGKDKKYLGVISINGFPTSVFPGILDELNRMNIEYRWCNRYIPMDKQDGVKVLSNIRREWFASRKTLFTMLKETITKSESAMVENTALDRYHDAQSALDELQDDVCSFGYFSATVIVANHDEKILENQIRLVEKTINAKGFTTVVEDLNAVGAWMGSLPGMARANIRWPIMSSLNLSYIFPISAVWAGEAWNKHLQEPALMQAETSGNTPFRFNLHYNDVGNAMIVGPIGSGKSVLLNTIEMHCRGYKDSRVYIFDKGGSCRTVTAGVGGEFYDLGNEENSIAFQPLRYIDQENERIWASEWLQMIYLQEGVKLTPELKGEIWDALNSLANSVADERTLSGFYMLVQSKFLRDAIEPFIRPISSISDGGPYGNLFDANQDTLTERSWQAFEMGELMNKKAANMPLLQYLFHVIEKRCKGQPTFIFLDECWVFLDNPLFQEKIREWFKTMRKNNVSVVFATQNLTDISQSKIAPAILESCYTRIFLPNPNALNPADADVYRMFSLNETEQKIIAMAVPKRQYYYKSILGCRLFELALSPFLLAYVASASKEDQAEVLRIQREYGKDDFNVAWLKYKNQEEALQFYKKMVNH